MPIAVGVIMETLNVLATDENIKVTVTQSLRGGAIAGTGAVVGGLLGGPIGMAVGGTIGSVLGAGTAKEFKPLPIVLKELPAHKQQELADKMQRILGSVEAQDAFMLIAFIQGSSGLRMQVLAALKDYVTTNLGMTVDC